MAITRVKICGITRPEDAALAAELGADAVGLNFVGGPRRIHPQIGREIVAALPPLVMPVALISAEASDAPEPHDIYNALRVLVFQLYAAAPHWIFYENECNYWWVRHVRSRGGLSAVSAEWGSLPKVFATGPSSDWRVTSARIAERPAAILLDTASEKLGGTGQTFNWHWIAEARDAGELDGLPPLILAGGLTPDNVADAIRIVRPYAVDVSSGVEIPAKPGIKDPLKLRDFIRAAKGAI